MVSNSLNMDLEELLKSRSMPKALSFKIGECRSPRTGRFKSPGFPFIYGPALRAT
jgi:hypothetical protein